MCQPLLVNKNYRNSLRSQNPLQSAIFNAGLAPSKTFQCCNAGRGLQLGC